jgi:hypothetical protein
MKRLLYLFLVLFVGCTSPNKTLMSNQKNIHSAGYQSLNTFNNDTATYVMSNFMKQKEKYINRNIELMLNDLEVPIVDVFYFGGNRHDIITTITLYLYNDKLAYYKGHKTIIYITLSNPLNKQEFMEKRKGSPIGWCDKDFELIKESQIANITVVESKDN